MNRSTTFCATLMLVSALASACGNNTNKNNRTAITVEATNAKPLTSIPLSKPDSVTRANLNADSTVNMLAAEPKKETVKLKERPAAIKKKQTDTFGYAVVNALPPNYVTDGSVDYTSYLQKAIDAHDQMTFPAFPVLINDKGLTIGSNKTIKFPAGSKILLAQSSKSGYAILRTFDASNITLINPVIRGDRSNHIGQEGEWGMGLDIRSSSNITVTSPKISNCWGDGIYLGQNGQPNKNIVITNAYCDNNRRNGISVISADGLRLISPVITNTNGTPPMAGLDIEPNSSKNELKGIYISGLKTQDNAGNGLDIVLNNLYGGGVKEVDINVINPKDVASVTGARIISFRRKAGIPGIITGNIKIDRPLWSMQKKSPIDTSAMLERGVKLKMQ